MSTIDPSGIEDVDKAVSRKYTLNTKLGKGAYGIVWKATKNANSATVALKKIFDAFQNSTDAQRTWREIVYLQALSSSGAEGKGHENIVKLLDLHKADNDKDIYLVFEYMETDLHAVIRANILEETHKQYIMYQAFRALMFLHSAGLVHRDMKPANLLLNSECLMKVADFGLARSLSQLAAATPEATPDNMTDYVATRWYRAPEILVGSSKYGTAVDLWSLGCIFGEMLGGRPVFSGNSTLNQIEKIVERIGMPSTAEIEAMRSEYATAMIDSLTTTVSEAGKQSALLEPSARWRALYPAEQASDDAIDLLNQLLCYQPSGRIQPRDGMKHNFCNQFYDAESEILWDGDPISSEMDDNTKHNTSKYREKLYERAGDDAKSRRGGASRR